MAPAFQAGTREFDSHILLKFSGVLAVVASQFHKLEVVGSNPTPATSKPQIMKKLDMMKSKYLSVLIKSLNDLGVQREDLVALFPPSYHEEEYTAVFYYQK